MSDDEILPEGIVLEHVTPLEFLTKDGGRYRCGAKYAASGDSPLRLR